MTSSQRCEHGIWMDTMCERCQRVPVPAEVPREGLTGPVVKAMLWDGTLDAFERICDWANKFTSIDDYVVSLSSESGALNIRRKDGWTRAAAPCWIVRSDDGSFSVRSAEQWIRDGEELVVNPPKCPFCGWEPDRELYRSETGAAVVLSGHLLARHVVP